MTSRGGGDPNNSMASNAVGRMGPSPRSLAAEANDCFMVRVPCGSNRIQGRGAMLCAQWRAPLGSFQQAAAVDRLNQEKVGIGIESLTEESPYKEL